jgi:hypothetical protein
VKRAAIRWVPILLIAFVFRLASCGGDTTVRNPSLLDGHTVQWEAPVAYIDYTPLDPGEELDGYELFVNDSGDFMDEELPAAFIMAVDPSGFPTESFDLGLLEYPFTEGRTYFFCMRSVTKAGVPSDFSRVFSYTIPMLIAGI